ncbi:MAG TPA: Hsp20/alpha crystallin family protein [Phenylobacterium sp.]
MTVQTPAKQFQPAARAASVFGPIQREFDRLLDQFGSGFGMFNELELAPRMDVHETPDGLEITLELPGAAADDVKVTVEDNVLTVSGEKKSETERKEEDCRVSERSYGAFSRSVTLPSSVDAENLTATMDKGVLKLVAPKNGKAQAKTIAIQAGK